MRYILAFLVLLSFQLSAQKVISITIDGTINPVSVAFIKRGLIKAQNEHAECLLIHLNTPGGLVKSTLAFVLLLEQKLLG